MSQHRRIWSNPYLMLALGALANTAAELFSRRGAQETRPMILGFTVLTSLWSWCGIVSYICGFLFWMNVLRTVPLGIAFTLIAGGAQVMVALGAHFVLGEALHPQCWLGVAMVVGGIVLIAHTVAVAEEQL